MKSSAWALEVDFALFIEALPVRQYLGEGTKRHSSTRPIWCHETFSEKLQVFRMMSRTVNGNNFQISESYSLQKSIADCEYHRIFRMRQHQRCKFYGAHPERLRSYDPRLFLLVQP